MNVWETFLTDIFHPIPLDVIQRELCAALRMASMPKEGLDPSFGDPCSNL